MNYFLIGLIVWLAPAALLGIVLLATVVKGSGRTVSASTKLADDCQGNGPEESAQKDDGQKQPSRELPEKVEVGSDSHIKSVP